MKRLGKIIGVCGLILALAGLAFQNIMLSLEISTLSDSVAGERLASRLNKTTASEPSIIILLIQPPQESEEAPGPELPLEI